MGPRRTAAGSTAAVLAVATLVWGAPPAAAHASGATRTHPARGSCLADAARGSSPAGAAQAGATASTVSTAGTAAARTAARVASGPAAVVRVDQVGYAAGETKQAFLMARTAV